MKLRFETQPQLTDGIEIPVLVEIDKVAADVPAGGVIVDGEELAIDERVLANFQEVVARMHSEKLPPEHYRDCVHFVMAMSGLWLPTHRPLDGRQRIEQVCEDDAPVTEHEGLIALGIPNSGSCLGFGSAPYSYSHSALGALTSNGVRYLHKLGVAPAFSLSNLEQALEFFDNEVSHPITRLSVSLNGVEMVWTADESDKSFA